MNPASATEGVAGMIKGFKEFILRGNVVDLAVAVVIGAALGAVVTSVVENLITPLLAALGGVPDTSALWVATVNGAEFHVGTVLGAILNFLFVAAAVYFVIVLPMNRLAERRKKGIEPEPEGPAEDVLLLQEIRDLLAARRDV